MKTNKSDVEKKKGKIVKTLIHTNIFYNIIFIFN